MSTSPNSREPYPENLSFEQILESVGGGVLLDPMPAPHKHIDTSMTPTEACEVVFGAGYMLRRMRKLHDPEDVMRAALPLMEKADDK